MQLPFEPTFLGFSIPAHLILEYIAFFVAFRYYLYLRKNSKDLISTTNRLSIILGAIVGALIGSRIMGFLEFPFVEFSKNNWVDILNTKTIMGGLFGGLLGVERMKKRIGEKNSSGDLFVFPIIVGISIGRIGCFLSGTNEFTYGKPTSLFVGINLGDGILRHPVVLYEIVFLIFLFIGLKYLKKARILSPGMLFQYFMISYFSFRFVIEFIKPNAFLLLGLSSIQYLCLVCLWYYRKTITGVFKITV